MPRAASGWPWRGTGISVLLHLAMAIAIVSWPQSPQRDAFSAAAEIVFWPDPDAGTAAPLEAAAPPPAEHAIANPVSVESVQETLEPVQAEPVMSSIDESRMEVKLAQAAEPMREPALVQALPVPPRPRPATASKPVESKPSVPESAAPQDAPAAAAAASAPAPATSAAAPASAPAEPADPPIVYEPRYRHPPIPPRFPPRALALNQQGTVIVRALVAPDGTSGEIIVWRSSGYALLDEAALRAVRDWAFEPASVGGRRIASWVEVPVRFAIR
jgi:protein TonB